MNKKFTLLLMACFAFSGLIKAQLNGTYTIGGTTPDYATMADALTDVQTSGVSGPVIFNIRPGTYSGKLFLNDMQGSSAVNTVTFQSENGDSTSVIITDPSSPTSSSDFTIFVNGGDYIRLNKITIERSGTDSYGTVLFMGSNSLNFTVTNCVVQSNPYNFTSLNSSLVRLPVGGLLDSLTTFRNNLFSGGSYGIIMSGLSTSSRLKSVVIENNEFVNQGGESVYLTNTIDAVVSGNNISSTTTSTQYIGVHMKGSIGSDISSNKIINESASQYGIFLETCPATSVEPEMVSNNFIVCGGNFFGSGIEVFNSAFAYVYHNTVHVTATDQSATSFGTESTTSNSLEILNNIFVNSGGGYSFLITTAPVSSVSLIDYNDFYAPANANIGIFDGDTVLDIADLQANHSAGLNSVSADAQFISATDLHAGSAAVNDLGIPLASVTSDIDGEARNVTSPDLGADEFTPLSDNLYMVDIISPSSGCGDSSTVIGVVIRNLGLNSQPPFDVVADVVFSAGNQTLTETTTGNLPSNSTDTLYFTQTVNTYGGGTLDLTVYVDLGADQYHANDTLHASYTFLDHPNAPTVVSPQDQCDNNLQLTATPDSGDVLMWYADPTSDVLLYSGAVFSPTVSGDTTFYVESRHGSGSSGCLRIVEMEGNGLGDYIELQNVSGVGFDATGYKVIASDSYTDISFTNTITWDLDFFAPGEIKYRTDDASDNYWGSNLLWEPNNPGWAMIIDPLGNIVDFVALQWDSATIQTLLINVNGVDITVGSEWHGDGTPSACSNPGETPSRFGNQDNNGAEDWSCAPSTKGIQNTGLATSFLSCGVGICASERQAIDVHLIPGVVATLGPDTAAEAPFDIALSPGQGYTSYLWSTGETTDTIHATAPGTYYVTVSGPNGCTITDTVVVSLSVGIHGQLSNDVLSFYPNPAKDQLTIRSGGVDLNKAQIRVFDSQGSMVSDIVLTEQNNKTYVVDLKDFEAGVYFVQVITDKGMRVERISVLK